MLLELHGINPLYTTWTILWVWSIISALLLHFLMTRITILFLSSHNTVMQKQVPNLKKKTQLYWFLIIQISRCSGVGICKNLNVLPGISTWTSSNWEKEKKRKQKIIAGSGGPESCKYLGRILGYCRYWETSNYISLKKYYKTSNAN